MPSALGLAKQSRKDEQPQSVTQEVSGEFALERRHRPFFILLTFAICTAVFVLELYENGRDAEAGGEPEGESCHYRLTISGAVFCAASLMVNPLFGPTTDVLLRMGASEGVLTVVEKEVWRLVTPLYLHGGAVHYGLNMLVLFKFGLDMECMHGFSRVGTIYVLSGIFGILMGVALSPHTVKVGASGAIFGLFGALLGEVLQNWGLYRRPCSVITQLTLGAGLQLLLGTMPMLDNFSHFFGFVMGFLCSLVLLVMKRHTSTGQRLATRCHQRFVQVTAAVCICACLILGVAAAFGPLDASELCPRCHLISCLPFPWGCNPAVEGSCWAWDCSAARVAGCSGTASWAGALLNGTVELRCPMGLGDSQNVTVSPVDLTEWSNTVLAALCKDHCVSN